MNEHVLIENIMMASLKMATVQWDIVLDVFEGTIRHEKCLCCRAFDYVWL